jgi:hypothetical protein
MTVVFILVVTEALSVRDSKSIGVIEPLEEDAVTAIDLITRSPKNQ